MKKYIGKVSDALQLLGRSMLLAIAVMPAAAILNRISDADLLNILFLKEAAWTIFAILPILFAVSVGGGIAKDKNVAAGLAAVVVYEILVRTLGAIGDTDINSFGRIAIQNVRSNILIGIIAGIIAGVTYEKFKDKALPSALSFFGGRRLVIIMSSLFAIIAALGMSFIFPAIEEGFLALGIAVGKSSIGPFVFGFLNRLLIPTGLHHILNTYIQMQLPSQLGQFADVTGEIPRYFAGDPTAGTFVSGFFPMMMFGLAGAALAMYRCAKPENKNKIKGLLLGAAFTSFVTGITEPLEFSFMFVSPILFVTHAGLMGLANTLSNLLNIKIVGVGGSGIIDYVLQFNKATNPLLVIVVGLILAALYYLLFSFFIKKFNLKTPGREPALATAGNEEMPALSNKERSQIVLQLLGGSENIVSLDNCITRLRLEVKDFDKIDVQGLKDIGIVEVIQLSNGKVHVIVGLEVESMANDIRKIMDNEEK